MQENHVDFDVQPLGGGLVETYEEWTVDGKFRAFFITQIAVYLILLCKACKAAFGKEYEEVFRW